MLNMLVLEIYFFGKNDWYLQLQQPQAWLRKAFSREKEPNMPITLAALKLG
jgi:hypothetical protein